MAVVCPSVEDFASTAALDAACCRDAVDYYALGCSAQQCGLTSACTVTQHTGSDMEVSVPAAGGLSGGNSYTWSATNLTIATAGTYDRRDTVVYRPGTGLMVVQGAQCTVTGWTRSSSANPPVKQLNTSNPSVSGYVQVGDIVLAEVIVEGGATAITNADIVDKTNVLTLGLLTLTEALELSLTETVLYPPTSPLKGNTGILLQQSETLASLPAVAYTSGAITPNGTTWTITFQSSILGTLGEVGDTFQCWTTGFTPAGYNVGNVFSTVTATITSATTATIAETSNPGAVTAWGVVNVLPVQYTSVEVLNGASAPRGILEIEGTNTFAQSLNALFGVGPAVQNAMGYQNATPITQACSCTSGSNQVTFSGAPPAGLYYGLRCYGPGIPYNAYVEQVSYNGTTTTVTLYVEEGSAANYVGTSGTQTLTFVADLATGEGFVNGPTTVGNAGNASFPISTSTFGAPGEGQGWQIGFWDGPGFLGLSGGSLSNIQSVNFEAAAYYDSGASGIQRIGFLANDADTMLTVTTTGVWGSLAKQIGVAIGGIAGDAKTYYPMLGAAQNIGLLNPSTSFFPSAPAVTYLTAGATIPTSGGVTLNVMSTAGFPSSGTILVPTPNSNVAHFTTVTYTSLTSTTFVGCTAAASTVVVAGENVLSSSGYQTVGSGFTVQANGTKATLVASASESCATTQVINPAQSTTVASCTFTGGLQTVTVTSGGFPGVSAGMVVSGTDVTGGQTVLAVFGNTLILSAPANGTSGTSYTQTLTFSMPSTPPYGGQLLVIENGSSAGNYLTFTSGGSTGLELAAPVRRLGVGGTLTLIYSGTLSAWCEVAYSSGGLPPAPRVVTGSTISGGGTQNVTPTSDTAEGYSIEASTSSALTLAFQNPTGTPEPMQPLVIRVYTPNVAATYTFTSGYKFGTSPAQPTGSTSGGYDYMLFLWNEGESVWDFCGYVQAA